MWNYNKDQSEESKVIYVEKAFIISWLKQNTTQTRLIYEYNQKLLFATVWITVLLHSTMQEFVSLLPDPNSFKVHQTRFPVDTVAFLAVKTAGRYSWMLTLTLLMPSVLRSTTYTYAAYAQNAHKLFTKFSSLCRRKPVALLVQATVSFTGYNTNSLGIAIFTNEAQVSVFWRHDFAL